MSGTRRGFIHVAEETPASPATPTVEAQPSAAIMFNARAITLGLKVLSERAVVALSALFTAGLVASAWFLWWTVLANPTTPQLIGLGGYAGFILLVEVVRRRSA